MCLIDIYQQCVDGFIHAVQVFEADTTGRVEKIALDGTCLILWAQLVGLDSGHLDPPLFRFQGQIELELSRLLSSFNLVAEHPLRCE